MSLPLRSLGGRGEGRGEVRVIPTKHQKPLDPLQIRLLRAQRQPVKPRHLPALLHEFELGIGRQPFQGPMQPFAGARWDVPQPIIALDKGFFQASNVKNERNQAVKIHSKYC